MPASPQRFTHRRPRVQMAGASRRSPGSQHGYNPLRTFDHACEPLWWPRAWLPCSTPSAAGLAVTCPAQAVSISKQPGVAPMLTQSPGPVRSACLPRQAGLGVATCLARSRLGRVHQVPCPQLLVGTGAPSQQPRHLHWRCSSSKRPDAKGTSPKPAWSVAGCAAQPCMERNPSHATPVPPPRPSPSSSPPPLASLGRGCAQAGGHAPVLGC